MGVDGLDMVLVDLVFVYLEQVEGDVIGVVLDCRREEVDVEWDVQALQEVQGEPELLCHNENHQNLMRNHVLLVSLQELQDVVMVEDQFRLQIVSVFPLVVHQHRYEVS